jgi:predicted RNA methylase
VNPPFGTKVKGIDMVFLEVAAKVSHDPSIYRMYTSEYWLNTLHQQLAKTSIYSLHKSSTRDYIQKKAQALGFQGQVLAEMRYDLPKYARIHTKLCFT